MRRYLLFWKGRHFDDYQWLDVPGWMLRTKRTYASLIDKRDVDGLLGTSLLEVIDRYAVEEA